MIGPFHPHHDIFQGYPSIIFNILHRCQDEMLFSSVFPCPYCFSWCFIRCYPQNFPRARRVQLGCRAHLWIAWLPPSRPSCRLQGATRSRSVGSVGSVQRESLVLSHVSSCYMQIWGDIMGNIWVFYGWYHVSLGMELWLNCVRDFFSGWNPKGALSSKLCHAKWKKSDNALTPRRSASCLLRPARPTTIHRCPNFTSAFPGFLEWWRYSKIGSNPWGFTSVGMEEIRWEQQLGIHGISVPTLLETVGASTLYGNLTRQLQVIIESAIFNTCQYVYNRIVDDLDDLGTSPNARCLMFNADDPWRNPRHLTPTGHPIAEGLSVSSRVPWMQNQNQQDYQDLIPLSTIQTQIWTFWSCFSTPTPKNWWCKFKNVSFTAFPSFQ